MLFNYVYDLSTGFCVSVCMWECGERGTIFVYIQIDVEWESMYFLISSEFSVNIFITDGWIIAVHIFFPTRTLFSRKIHVDCD